MYTCWRHIQKNVCIYVSNVRMIALQVEVPGIITLTFKTSEVLNKKGIMVYICFFAITSQFGLVKHSLANAGSHENPGLGEVRRRQL